MLAKNINGSEPGMMIDNRDTQETGAKGQEFKTSQGQ